MLLPPLLATHNVTIDVIRTAKSEYVKGRPVPGASEIIPVVCNVQPVLSSTDTKLIPEADRSKACLKVYTKGTEMRQMKEGPDGWAADRFYWQGELYEVMRSINYAMGILNHWKVICMRVELT